MADITEYSYEPEEAYSSEEETDALAPEPMPDTASDCEPLGSKYPTPAPTPAPTAPVQPATIPEQITPQQQYQPLYESSAPESVMEQENPALKNATQVQGFQLVQATGLTDTSTEAPKGSALPNFATPPIIPKGVLPSEIPATPAHDEQELPMPLSEVPYSNPLSDNSKSKQFTQRTDVFIF